MGFIRWVRGLLDPGRGLDELARRLGVDEATLRNPDLSYRNFSVPRRTGGRRWIQAPDAELRSLQRRVLRGLLDRLPVHPAAKGFERGESIVTHARLHEGREVVIRMDIEDFFGSTRERSVRRCFRRLGWNRAASRCLAELSTHEGVLPQGAPTSPRLSNLVNYRLDARLAGVARRFGANYSRYADDIFFSLDSSDDRAIRSIIGMTTRIVRDAGYRLHLHRKLTVRRRHQRQVVTGLVVNSRVSIPREVRRRLRAVEHRAATGGEPTLTPSQRQGWASFRKMVERQRG